jgi:hypothetical protein
VSTGVAADAGDLESLDLLGEEIIAKVVCIKPSTSQHTRIRAIFERLGFSWDEQHADIGCSVTRTSSLAV